MAAKSGRICAQQVIMPRCHSRAAFRRRTALDAGAWARAQGWALWKALITLAALDATPEDCARAARTLERVLADRRTS
ncbi:MAG: hypothetical protein QOK31_1891 [Solirubrobacteraceae bacterium]|nr:hypothetical protein [Solirubrobacteraceae bacterium]